MSHINWIAGIALAVLGLWSLLKLNRRRTQEPVAGAIYRKGDVKFVGAIVVPGTVILGTFLFAVTDESWTLANIITVYGGLFGISSATYAIWKM